MVIVIKLIIDDLLLTSVIIIYLIICIRWFIMNRCAFLHMVFCFHYLFHSNQKSSPITKDCETCLMSFSVYSAVYWLELWIFNVTEELFIMYKGIIYIPKILNFMILNNYYKRICDERATKLIIFIIMK